MVGVESLSADLLEEMFAGEKPVWDKFASTPEMKSLVQEIVNTK